MRLVIALVTSGALIVLGGCNFSGGIRLQLRSTTTDVATFEIVDPKGLNVTTIDVAKKLPSGTWKNIWAISGEAKIDSFAYGKAPKGFKVDVAPEPLETDSKYRLIILGDTLMAARGGGMDFVINNKNAAEELPYTGVDH